MLIEKIAATVYQNVTGTRIPNAKLTRQQQKARKWLRRKYDEDKNIDPDGQSRRNFEGKGGGFHENFGENTGGLTYEGQGGGYRRAV